MSDRKKLGILLAGLVLIGAVVGATYALHIGPWKLKDLGPVIARVDGRPIYLSQAEARVEGLSTVHGDIVKMMGTDWHDKVLQSLVDDQIIREEAERRGITVTQKEVAASVLRIQGMFPSAEEFQKWLDSQRTNLAELERRIELQALAARVYTAVTADVDVTDDEMRAYYDSHRAKYQQPNGSPAPFLRVRDSIRQRLEKKEEDQAFAAWLDDRRQETNVVVVLDDWWRNIL